MSRPSWTIVEAAERCGVSKSTVRRYRESDRFPHAWKDRAGVWRIPVEDLLAVGWRPVDPTQAVAPEVPMSGPTERERELEGLLAVERAKREGAERLAAMAEASVADLRQALRMLEQIPVRQAERAAEVPVPTPSGLPVPEQPERPAEQAEQPKKRWWSW